MANPSLPEVDLALLVNTPNQPGVLHELTRVITAHQANISYVDIIDERGPEGSAVYFELTQVADAATLIRDLEQSPMAHDVQEAPSFNRIFGKRIIVIGGGAQVGQVAVGAISESDRHNIRGERISVDTVPLVGEENL